MKNSVHSLKGSPHRIALLAILSTYLFLSVSPMARAQKFGDGDRARGRRILKAVKDELKDKYYDPGFHGIDIDTVFEKADGLMAQANSNNDLWGVIAQCLMLLDDSHTRFYPPIRLVDTNYGWDMQMIGDKCFVVHVEPGSDAEGKKLSVGDQVLLVEGIAPTRSNLTTIQYLFSSLRPQSGLRVVVSGPDGEQRNLAAMAKVKEGKAFRNYNIFDNADERQKYKDYVRLNRDRFHEIGNDALIWKMPQFDDADEQIDSEMRRAKRFKSLVLDLRGNGGGYESTLKRLLSYFTDADTTIGDINRRKESKPLTIKSRGSEVFKGQLVVLVDSGSASAAELFARTIQLEKRGTVIGDRTAGAVMRSRFYEMSEYYSLSITDADITMSDGKRLEHVGVVPDILMLPSGADLAARHDPVLAHAVSLLGITLTSEQAGAAFPREEPSRR
jgi:C-terminal processing protease CtpA/Prc